MREHFLWCRDYLRDDHELQSILDSTVEGIWTISLDGSIKTVNRTALELFGYASGEGMIGQVAHDLIHYQHADGTPYAIESCPIQRAFKAGQACHLEDEILWRADGTPFYADIRTSPLRQNGEVIGAVVTFLDNTERRRAQEELAQSRAWLSSTLRGICDAVIATDASPLARITYMNPVCETLVGWKLAEVRGKPIEEIFKIIHGPTRQIAPNPIVNVIREGATTMLAEQTMLLSRDGREYAIEDSASPIFGPGQDLIGAVMVFRDVTEAKFARESEKNQLQWLEQALNELPVPIYMADPETGEYTFGNRAMETMLGTPFPVGEKRLGLQKAIICIEEGTGRLLDFSEYPSSRAARGEDVQDFRFIWRTFTGDHHVSITSSRVPASFGNEGRIILAAHDITALIEARAEQEKLAHELELDQIKLDAMMSQSPIGVALTRGPTFIFEKVNANFRDLVGPREYIGRPWEEVYPELSGTELPELLRQVYETGITIRRDNIPFYVRAGSSLLQREFFSFTYHRIMSGAGEVYGVCLYARRTTQSMLDRDRLIASERQLASAVRVAKVGFYDWDMVKDELFMSTQMREDWGFYGNHFGEAVARIHPDDRARVLEAVQASLSEDTPYFAQYRVNREDGREIWIEAQGHPVRDETGQATKFIGTSVDITDRKILETNLVLAKEEADRANLTKSAFLANMSHEIRTPLSAILGYADLLGQIDLASERREHYLATILRNGKALSRIIDDILDLTKVEAGKLEMETTDFALATLVNEVAELLLERALAKGITFDVQIDPNVPLTIRSDATRIRQILINLVGNAIKFTEKGGVTMMVSAPTHNAHNPNLVAGASPNKIDSTRIEIRVRDTGIGIESANRDRLFKPFSQADSATSRKFGGTGLGLALSRRLATALGGDIELLSEPQSLGSTFLFFFNAELPKVAPKVEPLNGITPTAAVRDCLEGIVILVADDSPDNRYLASHLLQREGAVVETADHGQEAIDKARAREYDVVLMDIQMPEVDGLEATRTLRRSGYTKPILALTAHAMAEERARSREAGCDGHLTKPLSRTDLVQAILDLVRPGKSAPQ